MTAREIAAVLISGSGPLVLRKTEHLVHIVFMPDVRQYVFHLHLVTGVKSINGAEMYVY